MLISVKDLHEVFQVRPTQVLHVGAHLAEEEPSYRSQGWGHVTWVEAQPKLVQQLKSELSRETNTVLEGVVWEVSGEKLVLNIASNSQSSSLLDFGTHSNLYPNVTYVETIETISISLNNLLPENCNYDFINLDIQGVELAALRGLGNRISSVKWIYSEVNLEEVYKDCTLLKNLDAYLESKGFVRLFIKLTPSRTWGDAVYGAKEMYSDFEIHKMRIHQIVRGLLSLSFLKKVKNSLKETFTDTIRKYQ